MKGWVLAAGLLAAVGTTGAIAADLDDGPPDRRGAYDDPRYADIYKHPVPPPPPYAGGPPPRGPVYRQEFDDYGPQRRFPLAQHCVPREEVRDRLLRAGWHDFQGADFQGSVATFQARRPSGRLFSLAIDRCSGEVVSAVPLEPRRWGGGYAYGPSAYDGPRNYGPYAYGPRRWERPFY